MTIQMKATWSEQHFPLFTNLYKVVLIFKSVLQKAFRVAIQIEA